MHIASKISQSKKATNGIIANYRTLQEGKATKGKDITGCQEFKG